jgi:Tfp pilus assembly major pilin PilA
MKHFSLIFVCSLICILSSCIGGAYYQVYDVKSEGLQTKSNGLVYEDDNCLLFYNLWNKSGCLSFVFANKTDKDITIDLTRSFFIKNRNFSFSCSISLWIKTGGYL